MRAPTMDRIVTSLALILLGLGVLVWPKSAERAAGYHPLRTLDVTALDEPTVFDERAARAAEEAAAREKKMMVIAAIFGLTSLGFMIATIALAISNSEDDTAVVASAVDTTPVQVLSNVPDNTFYDIDTVFATDSVNYCENKNPKWENTDCVHLPGPQAGANVTAGYRGYMNVSYTPNTNNYWQSSMCPVNVHWHLGTEHYSVGEYDEFGYGPNGKSLSSSSVDNTNFHTTVYLTIDLILFSNVSFRKRRCP